jgi:hypothetical protein
MVFEIFAISIGLGMFVSFSFFIASNGYPLLALTTLALWVVALEMDRLHQKYERLDQRQGEP